MRLNPTRVFCGIDFVSFLRDSGLSGTGIARLTLRADGGRPERGLQEGRRGSTEAAGPRIRPHAKDDG
jgi:hypothetical protein